MLLLVAVALLAARLLLVRYGPEWPRRLLWPHPPGVIIHHSASPGSSNGVPVDIHTIDRWHAGRGFGAEAGDRKLHVGYHYVILPDGTIQRGRPEWLHGAHTRGHNDWIGVCLVGNFSSRDNPDGAMQPDRPTRAQLRALNHLLVTLARRYHWGPENVKRHRDMGHTACPGDRFPLQQVRDRMAADLERPSR